MVPCALLLLAAPYIGGNVAVIDIKTSDVRPELVPILTEILTTEISDAHVFDSVIAGRDVQAMLSFEEKKQILGCDDASCLAEIGGALGAERLIVPQVGRVAETYVVTIKMIDIRSAQTEQRVYDTVAADEAVLIASLRRSVAKLLGGPAPTVEAAATANVNGEDRAGVPVLPIVLLSAAAVSVGVGVGLGVKASGHADRAYEPDGVGSQREIAAGRASALGANIAYVAGGALAIGGVIAWILSGSDAEPMVSAAVDGDGAYALVRGRF